MDKFTRQSLYKLEWDKQLEYARRQVLSEMELSCEIDRLAPAGINKETYNLDGYKIIDLTKSPFSRKYIYLGQN